MTNRYSLSSGSRSGHRSSSSWLETKATSLDMDGVSCGNRAESHDKKKELMTQLCIAYCGILSKHNLCATSITGKYISDATGLKIERLLSGSHGGARA